MTALCILIVGITVTLYRRSNPTRQDKTAPHVLQYEVKNHIQKDHSIVAAEPLDDDPDVIPNKIDRRPDIFEPTYAKPERIKKLSPLSFGLSQFNDSTSSASIHVDHINGKDSWIYNEGYTETTGKLLSPVRPTTLPVHRNHDIYTRSSRVQESCI